MTGAEPGATALAPPPDASIADDVARALAEDLGAGDVTALLLEDVPVSYTHLTLPTN